MRAFFNRRTLLSVSVSSAALFAIPGTALAQSADQTKPACAPSQVLPDGTCAPDNQTAPKLPDEGAGNGNDVVVTGSRIATRLNATNGPVIVMSSADIEARGFTTLGDALNQLPAFGVPDSSPIGDGQSDFGPGQSFVNFFGLGSQRTLTLVNGHRFVGSNTASIFGPTGNGGNQVDLNLIPTELIDRTEVVAVGGAPIYGSDAIAGTINVILKKNYHGLVLDAQSEVSEFGDAPNYRVRGLAGFNFGGGKGNITVSGEFNQSTGLLYDDRSLTAQGRYYDTPQSADYPYQQQFYSHERIPSISEGGVPIIGTYLGLIVSPADQEYYGTLLGGPGFIANGGVRGSTPTSDLKFDNGGNLVPIDFGERTSLVYASGGNGYSLTDLSNLLTNTKRYSAVVTGNYNFSDHVNLSFEGWYTHSEGTNLREQPEYNGGLFGAPGDPAGGVLLSVNNPFLSAASRATILSEIQNNPFSDQNVYGINQDYFVLDRANTDITTGRVRGTVDVLRFVANLDGDFHVGTHDWKWEVSGNYGRSVTNSIVPTINWQNFENAAGEITADNPDGIPCLASLQSSSGPTITSTCAPLDLFGTGNASQAAKDYITMLATPRSLNTEQDYVASLTGGLFKLPGGDLSFALGYEHRVEHENFNPSAAYLGAPDDDPTVDSNGDGDPTDDRTSYGQTVPIAAIDAGYHTDEVFGELQLPVIGPENDVPFIHSLSFNAAGRYVHNSNNGGAFTWTLGGSWAPVADVTFRGNFTHSIRSPSITESENPAQQYYSFADDPCSKQNIGNEASTPRRANCLAEFTSLGLADKLPTYTSLASSRSFLQATAGEVGLGNETANSWTVGALLQPHWFRGFTLTVDYVDIKVTNVISSLGADDVLDDCYDSANFPNNQYCAAITRDPKTGDLSYIVTGYANLDQLRYRGIVAQGSYKFATPFLGTESAIGIGGSYQHLIELSSTAAGTTSRTDGDTGYSHDKGVLSLAYDNKGFEFYTQFQYIGPAKLDVNAAPDYYPQNHVNAILFTNVGLSYDINKQFQIRFNVDNVMGTKPPYPTSGTSSVYFEGLEGRMFRVGVGVHF